MIREAVAGDKPALAAYLARNFETTMFMRGNLRDFGLGNTTDMYAMRYFMALENETITGVCAVANFGTLMGEADGSLAEIATFTRKSLPSDFICKGILGAPSACKSLRAAFGMDHVAAIFDEVEPLFSLDLGDIEMPAINGFSICQATQKDLPMLTEWAHAYNTETGLHVDNGPASQEAIEDAKERINSEKFRILMLNNLPVAQTGFNAMVPNCVQIGGVYTPPKLRRNGFGRTAVAMHLAEVRERGVEKAILFAANKYAARAYMGIGFRQIGSYVITLFKDQKD